MYGACEGYGGFQFLRGQGEVSAGFYAASRAACCTHAFFFMYEALDAERHG